MDSSGVGWWVGSSDAGCPACRPSSGAAQPAPLGPSKARESWAAGRETIWGQDPHNEAGGESVLGRSRWCCEKGQRFWD